MDSNISATTLNLTSTSLDVVVVVVFFTLTDRASTIPINIYVVANNSLKIVYSSSEPSWISNNQHGQDVD